MSPRPAGRFGAPGAAIPAGALGAPVRVVFIPAGTAMLPFSGLDRPPELEDAHSRGNAGASTTIERAFALGSTALGAVIPVVYGTRRVPGVVTFHRWNVADSLLHIAVRFAQCECSAYNAIYLNSDLIATVSYLNYYDATKLGSLSQTIDSVLYAEGLASSWPGWVYIPASYYLADTTCPGQVSWVAELEGTLVEPIGGGTAAYSENPIECAYDIATRGEPWLSLAATKIDETSWQDVADWCDTVQSDSTVRWTFNGVLTERDPWAAIQKCLDHCHANLVPYRDKYYLWHEGERTASGITIDSSQWLRPPKVREIPKQTRADVMRVRYWAGAGFEQAHIDAVRSGATEATTLRRVEVNLDCCTNPSMAYRYGKCELALVWNSWNRWEGFCGRAAADLLPGDRFSTTILPDTSELDCRLLRITDRRDGTYALRFGLYVGDDVEDAAELVAEEDEYPARKYNEEEE